MGLSRSFKYYVVPVTRRTFTTISLGA